MTFRLTPKTPEGGRALAWGAGIVAVLLIVLSLATGHLADAEAVAFVSVGGLALLWWLSRLDW